MRVPSFDRLAAHVRARRCPGLQPWPHPAGTLMLVAAGQAWLRGHALLSAPGRALLWRPAAVARPPRPPAALPAPSASARAARRRRRWRRAQRPRPRARARAKGSAAAARPRRRRSHPGPSRRRAHGWDTASGPRPPGGGRRSSLPRPSRGAPGRRRGKLGGSCPSPRRARRGPTQAFGGGCPLIGSRPAGWSQARMNNQGRGK
jgi:hypothetical protein